MTIYKEKLENSLEENETKGYDRTMPRTIYSENKIFGPAHGIGNGTVIAFGNVDKNIHWNFANRLTSFLLKDKYIRSILVSKFRRKFPTVWCTLGLLRPRINLKFLDYVDNLNGILPKVSTNESSFNLFIFMM